MSDDPLKPSDMEIVRRVSDGNVDAFAALMERYGELVLKIVKRHVPRQDVAETAQDVFVRAYGSLSGFRAESQFGRWLSAIAVRTCYDYWRKAYRSREIPMSALTDGHRDWLEEVISAQSEEAVEERASQKEARELLDWALNQLSPEDRMVLELVYLEGLSGKEAAELLGWSVANVKVRSFRSRKKLTKILSGVRKTEQEGRA